MSPQEKSTNSVTTIFHLAPGFECLPLTQPLYSLDNIFSTRKHISKLVIAYNVSRLLMPTEVINSLGLDFFKIIIY